MNEDLFEPVAGVRMYESVVKQILGLISRGELAAGAALPPERDLADRLKVSRNVLREAFRVLEVRGIVHSRPGGGRFVRAGNICEALAAEGVVLRLEAAVISDVLEARELIEVQVARLAVAKIDDSQLEVLQRLREDEGTSWESNARFHTAIAGLTGNFMLERLVRLQLDLLFDIRQRDHYRSSADARRLLREHRAIIDAIAIRDADAAEAAVRQHFRHTREAVQ